MTINDLLSEEVFGNTCTAYHNGDDKFADYLKNGNYKSGESFGNM